MPCCWLKFRHVHCTCRNFSGKVCKLASSTDPCQLCIIQGRADSDDIREVAVHDEEVDF
jgi:hypothetical protein